MGESKPDSFHDLEHEQYMAEQDRGKVWGWGKQEKPGLRGGMVSRAQPRGSP